MAGGRYGNPFYEDPAIAAISSNIAKIFAPPDANKAESARLHRLQGDEVQRRLTGRSIIGGRLDAAGGGPIDPATHAGIIAEAIRAGVDPRDIAAANVYYQSNTGQPDSMIGRALVGSGKTLGPNDGVSMGDRDTIIRNQEAQQNRRAAIAAGPGYASVAEQRRNNDQRLAWEREKDRTTPFHVPPGNALFTAPGDQRVPPGFQTGGVPVPAREPTSVQAREVKILDVLRRNPGMDPGEAGKIVDGRVKYQVPPDQPGVVIRIDMETGKAQRVPVSAPPDAGQDRVPPPSGSAAPASPASSAFNLDRATSAYDSAAGLAPSASRAVAASPIGVIPQLFGGSIAPETRAATTQAILLNNTLVRGLMVGRAERERRDVMADLPTFGPMSNPRDQAIKLDVIHRRLTAALEEDKQRLLQPMQPAVRRQIEEGIRYREDAIREIESFVSRGDAPPAAPGAVAPGPARSGPATPPAAGAPREYNWNPKTRRIE